MFILYTLIYIIALLGISSITLILFSKYNVKQYGWFIALACTLMVWLSLQFASQLLGNTNISLYFVRLSIGLISLMSVCFFGFVNQYFNLKSSTILKLVLLLISLVFLLLSPTGLMVKQATSSLNGISINAIGMLYPLVLIYNAIIIVVSFARLIIFMLKPSKTNNERIAIRLLFYGLLQFAIVILFASIFLSNNTLAQILVPITSFLLVMFIAYGILKHGLFDVRIIVTRSVAYTLSMLVVVVLYSTIAFAIVKLVFKLDITYWQEIFFAIFSAVIALIFQPIKNFFNKITNRLFYRDAYDYQELLNAVNSIIVTNNNLQKLLNLIAETIEKNIKTQFCNFYIDEKALIDFHIAGTDTKLFANQDLSRLLMLTDKDSKKIYANYSSENSEINELMKKLEIDNFIRMVSQNESVGYLITGPKLSGNSYSNQDYQLLEIIADEVAIAAQNTLRYEEIARFNVTLQNKIEDATSELKKTNQKLKTLDEAKDEFISMASHQLRTPLTAVKGYISMLLEGDGGKTTTTQKNFLSQAFLSSQRMVYIISDLLNVSRLKTGKFVIELGPTYLPDVVEGELSQLYETAKSRGLEIIYNKPKEFPVLNLDETKTRQVIMNFADNAIYYTPKGGHIIAKLTTSKNTVEFTIKDTGIGVPKSEQYHLFTKFYRAGNARKARPDGTGLGLFMAKKVIIAEGGAIIFETQEGRGSTFGFSLPRNKLEIKTDTSFKKTLL